MAEYTLKKIKLPNGDILNITDDNSVVVPVYTQGTSWECNMSFDDLHSAIESGNCNMAAIAEASQITYYPLVVCYPDGGSIMFASTPSTYGGNGKQIWHDSNSISVTNITSPTIPIASTSTPLMDGTASYGSGTIYARGNHRHPTDTSRQEALVSGTNIKTVNGESILDSGDLGLVTLSDDQTISGSKTILDHSLKIRASDGSNGHGVSFGFYPDSPMALIYGGRASSNNKYHFSRYLFFVASYDSSTGEPLAKGELYRLGTSVASNLTEDVSYDIHTSKQSGPATTTTVTSGVVTRSSGATLVSQSVSQWGKVVTLCLTVKTTASVAAGANVFQGTVAAGYRPATKAIGGSYYGSSGMFCVIDTNGSLTVRNIAAAQSANSESGVSITYIIP